MTIHNILLNYLIYKKKETADRVENLEDVKKARLEEKDKRRKQKINQLIMQNRKIDTHQDELNNSNSIREARRNVGAANLPNMLQRNAQS
jgi:hypothetical protein